MIIYHEDKDLAEIDGLFFRRDKKTGYYLSSKPINGRRKRLHVYVWEKERGKIPEGMQIHHKDFDKGNNEIDNLSLVNGKKHQHFHSLLRSEADPNKFREMQKIGNEAAKAWHKSKAGHEWHKKHYQDSGRNMYREHEEICAFCGKKLVTTAYKVHYFCSNNCKSAFRRKSGVDNEARKCVICGKEFTCNKYSKQETCSRSCGRTLAHKNKENMPWRNC